MHETMYLVLAGFLTTQKKMGELSRYSIKVMCWRVTSSIPRNVNCLNAFEKLRKETISLEKSVPSHGTSRLPIDGFS